HDERRTAAIDHRISELGGDDFATQPMMLQRVGEMRADLLGEIAGKLAAEIAIVRHRRYKEIFVERKLGVSEQDRKLRAGERLLAATTFCELHVVGELFDGAVEKPACLQGLDQTLEKAEILHAAPLGKRERKGLQVVVAQHQAGDLIGHLE